jgi:hypothetical protein
LAQRQVERGGLEGPAAIVARDVAAGRRLGPNRDLLEPLREGVERPLAREVERIPARGLQRVVILGVVDDVLAGAGLTVAVEFDQRGFAYEGLSESQFAALDSIFSVRSAMRS